MSDAAVLMETRRRQRVMRRRREALECMKAYCGDAAVIRL